MAECELNRDNMSRGIQESVRQDVEKTEAFNLEDDLYIPKDYHGDHQTIANDINQKYGDEIFMAMDTNFGTGIPTYAIVEPSPRTVTKYMNKLGEATPAEKGVNLSEKDNQVFKDLQDRGLISRQNQLYKGQVYYKIPGDRNPEALTRLKAIKQSQGLDWLHISEGVNDNLIQLGKIDDPVNDAPREESTTSTKAGAITKTAVLHFLDRVGFRTVQTVNNLEYKGERLKGDAYIDFLNGVMQIVEGKEDYTLPEEGMHILTQLIKESQPELYDRLHKEVINYNLYRQVLNDPAYKDNKLYKNEDGTQNIGKIRDEAIGKLLAEFLINRLESTAESTSRIQTVYNLWQQVLNWIRETFTGKTNPFKQALDLLNEDTVETLGDFRDISSDDIFMSAKSVDQIDGETPDNKDTWTKIKNRPTEDHISKVDDGEQSAYYKDGKVATGKRVSDLVNAFKERLFGKRNLDESQKAYWEQSRKDGTIIHSVMENIINSWIDPATGIMKRNPSQVEVPDTIIEQKILKELNKYIKPMMASYPQGTRFLTEQIVHDKTKDIYGTIDFLAILPSGKVDILDWKSMLLPIDEAQKDYRKESIAIQLNEYVRILKDDYGIKDIGKIRAIPINKKYSPAKPSEERKLLSIQIGDANAAKITKDLRGLRPIISPAESTGSPIRDEMVKVLESQYQKFVRDPKNNREVLSSIQEAIYEIRVKSSIDNLTDYFKELTASMQTLIKSEGDLIKNNNKQDINEALKNITMMEESLAQIVQPSIHLQRDTSVPAASRAALLSASSELTFLGNYLKDMRAKLLDNFAKTELSMFDLLLPEKVVGTMARWFRSMGSNDMATSRVAFELTKHAYSKIDISTDEDLKALQAIKAEFDKFRKDRGLKAKDLIGKLVNYATGKFYSKIDPKFEQARQEILETKNADKIHKFVKENYNPEDYTQWYNKEFEDFKRRVNETQYDVDEKKDRQKKNGKIKDFQKNYDINKFPVTAFGQHNHRLWDRNIKEEKWYSPEYQNLIKPENATLLKMYDHFVKMNEQLVESGAIKDRDKYTFFPNVRKTLGSLMSFDDDTNLHKIKTATAQMYTQWRKMISVEDYELNYQGARDPVTGEKLNKRYVAYVRPIDPEEKSFDLFTIYGLMAKEIRKEEYLATNDEILRSLVHLEKSKQTLQQNKFGVYDKDASGNAKLSEKTGINAPILEEHIRALVNGEKIQYESDTVFTPKLREKWNKSFLGKLYKFDTTSDDYKPTNISGTKFLMWLNNTNMRRTLGLNAFSAISNLFGGTYASNKLYERWASKEDLMKSWGKMTSGNFYSTEASKKNAALVDMFLPLLQNREAFKASQLSVNDAAKVLSQEWLMAPMRKTSEIVQLNIFLAVIDNSAVIDGNLVNLREYVSTELNYNDRYKLSESERKDIEKQYDKRIKDLKATNGLNKVAQFKTIKEAGKDKVVVEIPGIDRHSMQVEKLRDMVQTMSKDALGEADEFDIAPYRYSIYGRLFMTFKNWIPRQADVRFGEFRFDQAHQSYEYGRLRMFARSLSANYLHSVLKIIPLPYITGKITDAVLSKNVMIAKAKDIYQEKIDESKFLGRYDPNTFISEGEFVDKFIAGADASFEEVRTMIFMGCLLFFALSVPDPDDDKNTKYYKTLARKQLNKLIDEVSFFYNPKSGIDIVGTGAPVFGIVKDSWNLFSDMNKQFFGFTFENLGWTEEGIHMQEQAKPMTKTFKMFPVLKTMLDYLPAIDQQTASEWGVKVSDGRGF